MQDYFFLNPGNVPLVFWDELRSGFPIAVPWHIVLELAILAFKCPGGMVVPFIVRFRISLLFFPITRGCIHPGLQKLLEDVFETVPEQGVYIGNTADVISLYILPSV